MLSLLWLVFMLLSNNRLVVASCAYGTSLSRRETAVDLPNFGYGTTDGPINWHAISPENWLCASGTLQSPINIDQSVPMMPPGFVTINIPVQENVKFENLGTTVEVVMTGETTVGNQTFTMKQFHFHTPSEHRINNEHFPVEVHMVHEAAGSQIAVISMIAQVSAVSTAPLDIVISNVNAIPNPGMTTTIPILELSQMVQVINQMAFFSYTGSLTTPPCTEGINFLVSSRVIPLQVDMYNGLKAVVGTNNRHIQNTAGKQNILAIGAQNVRAQQQRQL
ncbi:alpha carbonic anhydrase, partial [Lipomyces tetrasporus]